jgi:hypothetical protein
MVRSPSKHRHYGQTVEEASSARSSRSLSISKLPNSVMEIKEDETDDEKGDLKIPSSTTEAEVDEVVKSWTTQAIPYGERSLSNATYEQHDAIAGGDRATTDPSPKTPKTMSRHVPVIRIQIPSDAGLLQERSLSSDEDAAQRSSENSHAPIIGGGEGRDGSDHMSTGMSPRRTIVERLNSITVITRPAPSISSTSSDDETPGRVFEAFPTLNRTRWFSSIVFAVVSCVLTVIMIIATLVYNILQAAHGNS